MRHLNSEDIKKGHFVMGTKYFTNVALTTFLHDNIGEVIEINFNIDSYIYNLLVKYNNIPKKLKNHFINNNNIRFSIGEIFLHSNNKEDLICLLDSEKYNL